MALHSTSPIVLLGESHANADHHRWQLHTTAALHGRRPNMVLGVEMLPRRAQPILDRWVAGELTVAAFLEAVEWDTVWGFDADFYLPLFHFARLNRVPMVALNVDRPLIAEVGREGWAAVPEENREGVSMPAPASDGYRRSLAEVYALKHQPGEGDETEGEETPDEKPATIPKEELQKTPAFQRFVEAQLTWDRAMAEVLAQQAKRNDGPLVVGIIGRGHLENRWGVPHQLAALGIPNASVLLPWQREHCNEITTDLADNVFLLDEDERDAAWQGPRLGIMVMPHRDGLRIVQVGQDSVAEAAGLAVDDLIVSIGEAVVRTPQDLTAIIRKQAPGATLPLSVRRGSKTLQIVARFPKPPPNAQ